MFSGLRTRTEHYAYIFTDESYKVVDCIVNSFAGAKCNSRACDNDLIYVASLDLLCIAALWICCSVFSH